MKFKFIYILTLAIFAYLVFSSRSAGPANTGLGGRTGAIGEGLCSDCHGGGSSPTLSIQLLNGANPITAYTAGQSYTLRISVSGGSNYGAQATILNTSNNNTGTLSAANSGARISNANGRTYLEQSATSSTGIFTATWVAPASGTGNITIYAAGLLVNSNGGTSGDGTANTQLTITENVVTTINYLNTSYCANVANPTPTVSGTTGGTFSSTSGLVFTNTSTGQINLASSTAGTYTVTYTYNGGTNTTTDVLTITPQDIATFSYANASICQNAAANPTPTINSTSGGTFNATPNGLSINNNTGVINLSTSAIGNYAIAYTTSGVCPTTISNNLSITAANSSAFSYAANSFCAGANNNPTPTITGTTNGNFAAPNGLAINASTGEINLSSSTAANYSVTYTSPAPCPSSSVFNIIITARPTATINYPTTILCQNNTIQQPIITGFSSGTYTSLAGLDIDANTGAINPLNSLQGNYIVNYNAGNCGIIATTTVQILPNDAATISYASVSYCQSQPNPIPTINGTVGGTFSAIQAGIILNLNTGEVDLLASSLGNYDIIYNSNGVCASLDTVQINILSVGNAFFRYGMDTICQNQADSIIPVVTGINGGVFSSNNPNLLLNQNNGTINISQSLIGNYEIIYTLTGVCPAADTVALTILEADTVSFYYDTLGFGVNFSDSMWIYCDYRLNPVIITSGQGGYFTYRVLNNTTFDTPPFFDSLTGQLNVGNIGINIDTSSWLIIFEINYISRGVCPDTASQIVYMSTSPCGAVHKTPVSHYQLFPNPVQSAVTIKNPDYAGKVQLNLYNAFGQLVESKDIYFSNQTNYEVAHLPTGLYWIEIQQDDGSRGTYKLIKN